MLLNFFVKLRMFLWFQQLTIDLLESFGMKKNIVYIVTWFKDVSMKLFQYQDESEVDGDWKFIYIIENRGVYQEMNPRRGMIEEFDYNSDEYYDGEDCLCNSYNATRLI